MTTPEQFRKATEHLRYNNMMAQIDYHETEGYQNFIKTEQLKTSAWNLCWRTNERGKIETHPRELGIKF